MLASLPGSHNLPYEAHHAPHKTSGNSLVPRYGIERLLSAVSEDAWGHEIVSDYGGEAS